MTTWVWEKIASKSGLWTIKLNVDGKEIFLHSKYDPIREAEQWVTGWKKFIPDNIKCLLVVGIGLGYHIRALAEHYPNSHIEVWEFNKKFAHWLKKQSLLDIPPNTEFYCSSDLAEIKEGFLNKISDSEVIVLIHQQSLNLIPPDLNPLKIGLEKYLLQQRALNNQKELLSENFVKNISLADPGMRAGEKIVHGYPALLVSAGPSLTKQLPVLKRIALSRDIKIAAVGTALKPLLKAGIIPDLIMISDPNQKISEQFNLSAVYRLPPFFYLSTANHTAVVNYCGQRYIVWQKGFSPAEQEADNRHEPIVLTGGSVATCLLDLLVKLGATSIALVGQDLAFTDGYSHAADTVAARPIIEDQGLIWVDDYKRQGKVPTSLNLYSYHKWFENYAQGFNKQDFLWNCTEGGAYIPGWRHEPLISYWNFVLRRQRNNGGDI